MTDSTKLASDNIYLSGSLPVLFAKTAIPIIVVMAINGFHTLADAYFLGRFVGPEALTGVTLMFPLYMLLVAVSTLVSAGFSSLYARLVGAGRFEKSQEVFRQALLLSCFVCLALVGSFSVAGSGLTDLIAHGDRQLADFGYTYIAILIFASPLVFVLALLIDVLRCEGQLKAMAVFTFSSAILNILLNALLIVGLGLGVAGSAIGTVLAQFVVILAILVFRTLTHRKQVRPSLRLRPQWPVMGELLALGAPSSLGYVGLALSAALTLAALQVWASQDYAAIAGAFGIITRLMTFAFLPLLGLSMAFQTIVGNNFGACDWHRSNASLKLALLFSFVYSFVVEAIFLIYAEHIGALFVDDPLIIAEFVRILPFTVMLMVLFGPLFMISMYFQAIGDAGRAALLGLSRTYLFSLPLIVLLPYQFGEWGIWYAGPVAEGLVLALTILVLMTRQAKSGHRYGLFEPPQKLAHRAA